MWTLPSKILTDCVVDSVTDVWKPQDFLPYLPADRWTARHWRQKGRELFSTCKTIHTDFLKHLLTSIYLRLYSPFLNLGRFLSFLSLYTGGRTPWKGDQPVARPLPTRTTTQNKRTQTSMPWVGFEPTIPVFKRAKTVRALDRAATVIGTSKYYHGLKMTAQITIFEITI
jgi:hypothetical protein